MTGSARLAGALCVFFFAVNADAQVATGQKAPGFAESDAEGLMRTLDAYAGKTLVLEWTNHRCPFVKKYYSKKAGRPMQTLQAEAAENPDLVWLSVVSSAPGKQGHVSPEKAGALTSSRGAAPDAVLLDADGDMGRAYGARTTPHMFVIAPDGRIAYQGAIDSIASTKASDVGKARNYVDATLRALENGQTPDPGATPPYGCSVKY